MLRPYSVRFLNPNDSVHVVGHCHEVDSRVFAAWFRGPAPYPVDDCPNLRIFQDAGPTVGADGDEVRPSDV